MAATTHLISSFQRGRQIHQPLYLYPVPWSHVADMVEVGGRGYHFGPPIRVPTHRVSMNKLNNKYKFKFTQKKLRDFNFSSFELVTSVVDPE